MNFTVNGLLSGTCFTVAAVLAILCGLAISELLTNEASKSDWVGFGLSVAAAILAFAFGVIYHKRDQGLEDG